MHAGRNLVYYRLALPSGNSRERGRNKRLRKMEDQVGGDGEQSKNVGCGHSGVSGHNMAWCILLLTVQGFAGHTSGAE